MSLGKDRVTRLLQGEELDCVPVFPFGVRSFAALNAGYTVADSYADVEKSVQAEIWAQQQYGYDGFPYYAFGGFGAWEFGGEIRFPTGEFEQAPMVVRHPVATEEDVEALQVPGDIANAGAIQIALAHSRCAQLSGLTVVTPPAGVFTTACNLCGVQKMARWMIKKPEAAHRLLALSRDFLIAMIGHWVDTFGSDIIMYDAEPSAANQVISARHFEEYVVPYAIEVHSAALKLGIPHIMTHICGDQNLNLPHWKKIPMGDPGLLTFGHEVELETAIDVLGENSVIGGNVEPALILTGHPSALYANCVAAIAAGRRAPRGFVLMSGCAMAPATPPYNMYTMIKAGREAGCR
jgi:uroporphyrinogen decarboxylase